MRWGILLGLALFWGHSSGGQPQDERILNYFSDIVVNEDGTMLVRETIKVRSNGEQIRRGIYRSFPVLYKDRLGNNIKVRFHVEEVLKDGISEPFHIKKEGRNINLYIGDAGEYLNPDIYTYEIVYSTNRQLGYFDEYDELYWNAIGTGWSFPIDSASALIALPEDAEILQYQAYSGPQGSTSCGCTIRQISDSKLKVSMNDGLKANEGLTVAVGWPKGVVSAPTLEDRLGWFFRDNQAALYGMGGLVVVFLYYLYAWLMVGKDPDEGVIVPLFKNPHDLSPAAVRYIMNMGFDNQAFAATLISLAVKGAIRITEKSKVYTLHKVEPKPDNLSTGEMMVLNKLLGSKNSLKLSNKNHSTINSAVSALKGRLKTDFQKKYFLLNRKWVIPGALLTAVTLGVMFLSSEIETNGDEFGIILWLSIWSVACAGLVTATIAAWKNVITHGWSQIGAAIFMSLFSLPFLGAELLVVWLSGVQLPWILLAIGLALLLINILFYQWLKAPTLFGRQVMDKLEGFKLYLSKAEKYRLNWLNPPDKTPQHFEQLLPFAMALGVAHEWGEQFEEALLSAGREGKNYQPSWYSGNNWNDMRTSRFTNDLSSSFSKAVASSTRPPGSSSSGGGGFSSGGGSSGGGGGGGGGGGW